uniref:Uncharacterized protein n=1 Tax=Oryza punctata TaxID=4537 RepID=A0A0E0L3N7_ORYPU
FSTAPHSATPARPHPSPRLVFPTPALIVAPFTSTTTSSAAPLVLLRAAHDLRLDDRLHATTPRDPLPSSSASPPIFPRLSPRNRHHQSPPSTVVPSAGSSTAAPRRSLLSPAPQAPPPPLRRKLYRCCPLLHRIPLHRTIVRSSAISRPPPRRHRVRNAAESTSTAWSVSSTLPPPRNIFIYKSRPLLPADPDDQSLALARWLHLTRCHRPYNLLPLSLAASSRLD